MKRAPRSDSEPPEVQGQEGAERARLPGDPLLRPLGKRGRYWVVTPTTEDQPLEGTWLGRSLKELVGRWPLSVAHLADFYEHRVRPLVREADKIMRREWASLEQHIAAAKANNETVQSKVLDLQEQLVEAEEAEEKALGSIDVKVNAALAIAARKITLAGLPFDPTKLDEASVLGLAPRDDRHVAADLLLPHRSTDALLSLHAWVSWGFTVVLGVVDGLSLFSTTGAVHIGSLGNDPPLNVALAAGCGIVVAATASLSVQQLFRLSAENKYLGHREESRQFLFAGVAALSTFCLIDAFVAEGGLLRMATIGSSVEALGVAAAATQEGGWRSFIGAFMLFLGYLVHAAVSGALKGRGTAANRILAEQAREVANRRAELVAVAGVREALAEAAAVRVLWHEREECRVRSEKRRECIESKIRAALAEIRHVPDDLSEPAARRVHQALNDARWAQEVLDRIFVRFRTLAEPAAWWRAPADVGPRKRSRVWDWLRGLFNWRGAR